MKDINKILMNPIRMKLIQYLATHGQATPGELSEQFSEIPCSSLYRHIGVLADAKIIYTVSEEKVRGAIERTYALGNVPTEELSGKDKVSQNTYSFLMGLYSDFANFFAKPDCDPSKEKLFLTSAEFYLDDEEFSSFIDDISDVIEKYSSDTPDTSKKIRKISIVSSPLSSKE